MTPDGVARTIPRVRLLHTPTPLWKYRALDARLGVDLWVKRDDASLGVEAGNKVRKLEFLLAEARSHRADIVVTCGAVQSNHARATAICARYLGMDSVLLLRAPDELAGDPREPTPKARLPLTGNVLLDRMVGADVRLISHAHYMERTAVMAEVEADLRALGKTPYVIPEGGSNGLGSFGYIEAIREVREQLDAGLAVGKRGFDWVVHACGSGGTAAGVAIGAAMFQVAERVLSGLVCDSAAYFGAVVDRIVGECRALAEVHLPAAPITFFEGARGPGYAQSTAAQRQGLIDVARASGLVLDPVYTGKAFEALTMACAEGLIARGSRVLFVHTGGLPGLLAQGAELADAL